MYKPKRLLTENSWKEFVLFSGEDPIHLKEVEKLMPAAIPEKTLFQIFFRDTYYQTLQSFTPSPNHEFMINLMVQFETESCYSVEGTDIFINEGLGFYKSSLGPIIAGKNFKPPLEGKDLFFDKHMRTTFQYGDLNPKIIQFIWFIWFNESD